MYKNQVACSVITVMLFSVIVIGVTIHGNNSRIFASGSTMLAVDSPDKAYAVWKEKGVHGRVLLLFDNYPHAQGLLSYIRDGGVPQLTTSNLVEFGVFNNIIRKVYFIVPDEQWEEFRHRKEMGPLRNVTGVERGMYLFYKSGISLIAITPSSLPSMQEQVLVYNNNQVFNPEQTKSLLSRRHITSDVMIFMQARNE